MIIKKDEEILNDYQKSATANNRIRNISQSGQHNNIDDII